MFKWDFERDGKMPECVARYMHRLMASLISLNSRMDPWVRGLARGYNTFYLGSPDEAM